MSECKEHTYAKFDWRINERYSALGTVVIQRIPKSTNSPSLNIYSAKERKGEPSLQVQVACYTTTNNDNDMSYIDPLFPQYGMALQKSVGELSRRPILDRVETAGRLAGGGSDRGSAPFTHLQHSHVNFRYLSGHGDRKRAYL